MITITLYISSVIKDAAAELKFIANNLEIKTILDDADTLPIVSRSITEGFDKVKEACQRYYAYGTTDIDNRHEAIYTTDAEGHRQWHELALCLDMPTTFNEAVTSSIRSYAHRIIVDNVVAAVLKNQSIENFQRYYNTADMAYKSIVRALQSRKCFDHLRQPHDWS